jgi:predicted metallopeptidase
VEYFWKISITLVRSGKSFIRYVLQYPSSGTFWDILHHWWHFLGENPGYVEQVVSNMYNPTFHSRKILICI